MEIPRGWCQCGCGQRTKLAPKTYGPIKKGTPLLYVKNHSGTRKRVRWVEEDRGFDTPCWIWTVSIGANGYGRDCVNGKNNLYAHRVAWEARNGPVPEGLQLDHLCRQRACVNPDHLEPVTARENTRRSPRAKLDLVALEHIRSRPHTERRELAARYGVTVQTITNVWSQSPAGSYG